MHTAMNSAQTNTGYFMLCKSSFARPEFRIVSFRTEMTKWNPISSLWTNH